MTTPVTNPVASANLDIPPRHSAQVGNFGQTPSQTVGPYFAYGLTPQQYGYDFGQMFNGTLAGPQAAGEHIVIVGHVFDGDGQPVPDAIVEISHADSNGRFPCDVSSTAERHFVGFGRMGTGTRPNKTFAFDTVKPGPETPGRAPCVHVVVMMRGLLMHVFTRMYFSDEASANAADPLLSSIDPRRQASLIAVRQPNTHIPTYTFNIHMQGPDETVFLDL